MSYILEALRKLEREKARTRKEIDPVRQLVRLDHVSSEPSPKLRVWQKLAIGTSVGILLIGATYWTTRHIFLSNPQALVSSGRRGTDVSKEEIQVPVDVQEGRIEEGTKARSPVSQDNAILLGQKEVISRTRAHEETGREERQEDSLPGPSLPRSEYRPSLDQQSDTIREPLNLEDDQSGESPRVDVGRMARSERRNTAGERDYAAQLPQDFPALKISAVAWSSDTLKRFAIVNLKSVHEGDSIDGAVVSEIQIDGVIFKWRGNEYRLLMSRH